MEVGILNVFTLHVLVWEQRHQELLLSLSNAQCQSWNNGNSPTLIFSKAKHFALLVAESSIVLNYNATIFIETFRAADVLM